MDLYVREFGQTGNHDEFYTNPKVINAFKNYISKVISRYVGNSTILGWELANDPRCFSTLPASSSCNTHTITSWANSIGVYSSGHLIDDG